MYSVLEYVIGNLDERFKTACEKDEKKDCLRPFIKQQGALHKEKNRKEIVKIEIEKRKVDREREREREKLERDWVKVDKILKGIKDE